jgi:hypothetical protein
MTMSHDAADVPLTPSEIAAITTVADVRVLPSVLFSLTPPAEAPPESEGWDEPNVQRHGEVLPLARALYAAAQAAVDLPDADDMAILAWVADVGAWNHAIAQTLERAGQIVLGWPGSACAYLGLSDDESAATLGLTAAEFKARFSKDEIARELMRDAPAVTGVPEVATKAPLLRAIYAQVPRVFRRRAEVEAWLASAAPQVGASWRERLVAGDLAATLEALRAVPSDLRPVDVPMTPTATAEGVEAVRASRADGTSARSDRAHPHYDPVTLRRSERRYLRWASEDGRPEQPVRLGLLADMLHEARSTSARAFARARWRTPAHTSIPRSEEAYERDSHAREVLEGRMPELLASSLAAIRWWLGLADDEIADIVGADPAPVIARWLRGETVPAFEERKRLEQLARIASTLPRHHDWDQASTHAALLATVPVERVVRAGRRTEAVTEQVPRRDLLFAGKAGLERLWSEAWGYSEPEKYAEWTGNWVTRADRARAAQEREEHRQQYDRGLPGRLVAALPPEERERALALLERARALTGAEENGGVLLAALQALVDQGAPRRRRAPARRQNAAERP